MTGHPHDPARAEADGRIFRDLNNNGVLDPFEDDRLPVQARVEDLLARLSLREKVGLMFHTVALVPPSGRVEDGDGSDRDAGFLVEDRLINHLNVHRLPEPGLAARWVNDLQRRATNASPHGIPVTLSTDPRHSVWHNAGASLAADFFSVWPEPLGLAALGDTSTVRQFASLAREEYVAVGLRAALHPSLDLATEPRWARQYGTFGQDAELAGRLAQAYLDGFEGDSLGSGSVSCMVKHFPGGGPQQDGEDPHFPYGQEQVYTGDWFDYHLEPFRRVLSRGVSAVMPYYGRPSNLTVSGEPIEEVGFGFNRQIIQRLLRDRLGYDGVVCTDWGLLTDTHFAGQHLPARAWGVQHLTVSERALKVIDAGCDQFGGEECPHIVEDLVERGLVTMARIDASVRRLLTVKFQLGLFDNPFVDEAHARATVGNATATAAGHRAQAESVTVLTCASDGPARLPIPLAARVHAPEIDDALLRAAGLVPAPIETADVALIRIAAPYEPRNAYMLEDSFRAGSLELAEETVSYVREVAATLPVVLVAELDRPAILTPLMPYAATVCVTYGTGDAALLDALTGTIPPRGTLPFDLPSSSVDLATAHPAVPGAGREPLFPAGFAWPAERPSPVEG